MTGVIMATRVSLDLTRSFVFLLAIVLASPVLGAQPQQQAATTRSPEASSIPEPQIAGEAMRLKESLRGLAGRLTQEPSLAAIEQEVNELGATIKQRALETETVIKSGATVGELQQLSDDWQFLRKHVSSLAQTLSRQASVADEEARSLRNAQLLWDQTYDQVRAQKSPKALLDLTRDALDAVQGGLKPVEEQRQRIIVLQQAVLAHGLLASGELEDIQKGLRESQRSLFERDSPPLWKVQFSGRDVERFESVLQKSYALGRARLMTFVRANRFTMFVIAVMTVAALALFIHIGKLVAIRQPGFTGHDEGSGVFSRPASLAMLFGLVATTPLLFEAPAGVRGLVDVLAVVPVARLLSPRMRKPFRQMLFALFASVLTWELIQSIQLPNWITRDVLAILSLVVMVLFWGQSRAASRNPDAYKRPASLLNRAVHVGLVLMLISLFANVLGYFGLSSLIGNGTLVSGYRAVGLYTVFVAGTSIVAFALQTNLVRRLAVVRGNSDRIVRGISVGLALLTFGVWLHTTLSLFGIRADVYQAVRAGFAYKVTLGTVSFAPGNIVVFLLTLFFGYMIASMASAILWHEILPRLNLERGLPDAITTITRYVSLLVIFLLALAVGGVELSRFSLLTGAFGVGIGFGLQNVVNNFFSGLILLFERPVRIGDSLEVGGVSGEVTKIGFRSSTLHSGDGADLIIPNANLISQQVINWTLSGTRRRVSLRVHVAHGNDPEFVRDLLLATAASHPDVLKNPAPTSLFLGFGESALDFEVLFWAPGSDIAPALKSQVALRVAAALRDAGIEVPFPQRDLHFKTVVEPAREGVAVHEKNVR